MTLFSELLLGALSVCFLLLAVVLVNRYKKRPKI